MSRTEMWKEFLIAGEWGLKEQFQKLSDEEIKKMTPTECIVKCYMMLDQQEAVMVKAEKIAELYQKAEDDHFHEWKSNTRELNHFLKALPQEAWIQQIYDHMSIC